MSIQKRTHGVSFLVSLPRCRCVCRLLGGWSTSPISALSTGTWLHVTASLVPRGRSKCLRWASAKTSTTGAHAHTSRSEWHVYTHAQWWWYSISNLMCINSAMSDQWHIKKRQTAAFMSSYFYSLILTHFLWIVWWCYVNKVYCVPAAAESVHIHTSVDLNYPKYCSYG